MTTLLTRCVQHLITSSVHQSLLPCRLTWFDIQPFVPQLVRRIHLALILCFNFTSEVSHSYGSHLVFQLYKRGISFILSPYAESSAIIDLIGQVGIS